jgi:hypothetical protein
MTLALTSGRVGSMLADEYEQEEDNQLIYDDWDIRLQGRAWSREEIESRYFERTPEKIELVNGRLFWDHDARLNLLACLLENLGVDAAVRLGDPAVWRAAIEALDMDDPPASPPG